jgi:hypothetical protein
MAAQPCRIWSTGVLLSVSPWLLRVTRLAPCSTGTTSWVRPISRMRLGGSRAHSRAHRHQLRSARLAKVVRPEGIGPLTFRIRSPRKTVTSANALQRDPNEDSYLGPLSFGDVGALWRGSLGQFSDSPAPGCRDLGGPLSARKSDVPLSGRMGSLGGRSEEIHRYARRGRPA